MLAVPAAVACGAGMKPRLYGVASGVNGFHQILTSAPLTTHGTTSRMWRDSTGHRETICIESAMTSLTAVTAAIVASQTTVRRRNSGLQCRSVENLHALQKVQRRAVMESADSDTQAVQRWVDDFVIGHGFCPWAKPASEEGRIRIVSSDSCSEGGVLADLSAEALRLANTDAEPVPGQANTTLLVCAQVDGWQGFHAFNKFYVSQLAHGYAMADLELFIVAFHPNFGSLGPDLREGQTIELGENNAPVRGTLVDLNAGFSEQGQRLARVEIQGGGETYICLPPVPDPLGTIASRAPRPTLHLLRVRDLDEASDPGLHHRNRQRAKELGAQGAEALLRACG